MDETTRNVAADPADLSTYPWQEGCKTCAALASDPQPGLGIWLLTVADHMEWQHDLVLVRQ